MKNFILTLVMLITGLTTNSLNAQGSWTLQTNPTSDEGESMQFVSAIEGWIGLNSSQLLHTTNAGQTWNIITPTDDMVGGMDAPGSRISFINATTGWIMKSSADDNGNFLGTNLYKTINGGSTWTRTILSTNAGDAGIQVQFVDANNGWVLIYNMDTSTPIFKRTTDGGATWTTTNGGGIFYYMNENVGYAFSAGPQMPPPYTIFKTTDGGTNWTPQYVDNTSGELNAIQFTDVNNGWIVGNNGKIFKTTDGGANWIPITNTGFNANYDYNPLSFINSTTGWIAARNNSNGSHFTLATTNGGLTWSTQTLPFNSDIYSMNFWDENNGWAASDSYNNNGIDYPGQIAKYSVFTGTYSNAVLNGPWFMYKDLSPIDPNNDNLMYFVFDGNGNITDFSGFGGPWTGSTYSVGPSGVISGTLTNGSESFPFGGQLISETEGNASGDGQNWKLHKIANPGALKDKIVGTLSTANCGSRNVTLNIDSNGIITSATGLEGPVSGRVYADLGVYIGHIHTGELPPPYTYWREIAIWGNYSNNNLIGRIDLDDVPNLDPFAEYVFACGEDRTQLLSNLVRSDNTPVNSDWTLQTNPAEATADVGKIQFVTANEGWISISKGGLLHTTNGGATWTEVPLDLPEVTLSSMIDPAFNMCFINPLTGWVLKSFGTDPFDANGAVVYKTTNGGLNWQKIILSQ
ncbi:MAG TPA: YCF48-related protein, partial [Flavobacterium sp.]|nr:YCF48-related protein [Flavobacterium sp.]